MIPQFDEIRIQVLKELSAGVIMRAKDLRIPLAKHFGLTEEEMNAWYPSGNGEIFLDRISWALSYLFIAGLVEKPQRGDYKISEKGLSMLSSCTEEQINEFVKVTVNAKTPKKSSKNKNTNSASSHVENDDERTPEEELADSYNRIKQNVQSQILTTSDYTKGAMDYVESLGSPTIILINGQQLTEYIYDYGLGLQTEKVLKVMKMDMDYWDAMDNA